ncbi:MAG: two-component system, NtrC family, response regulator AtoC [Acidobacteriota bacterium]|jgi:transcriptional regulator with PAS, ATPase and Fis domain/Tfp pilus assembly protein PilF|nr:two-component system, NtrC family, response regulator AtoC [Acidobacteriota bacterium]
MNLTSQLLRQIDSDALNLTDRALLRCQLAKELEDSGNYEAARGAMGELWQRIGDCPKVDGLSQRAAAEVILRAGSLTGWIGSANQIEGAQEIGKNLISESVTIFEALQETEKVAEAYIDLAICYWREGAFDEARVTLRGVLDRLINEDSAQKARALLNSGIVEMHLGRFNDALHILTKAVPLFEKNQSHAAKGRFHVQLALVLKKLGAAEHREDYTDRALVEYAAASYHFEQAGHTRYRAAVENNLGYLLFITGKLAEACEHLDRAHLLFAGLKDSVHTAQVDDTRARVLLAQERNSEAEKISGSAVRTLEKGDEQSPLAEALTTHGVALAQLGRYEESHLTLERAIEVASQAGDNESAGVAALTIIEELGECLGVEEMTNLYERADQCLANSQNSETLTRLRASARRVLETGPAHVRESALPKFVYADEQTAELLRAAHRIASTQSTVLITGETGTGKELLARMIHEWSGRAGQFVAINCAALTETLLESILFGHLKGSFTDAAQDNVGVVRQAAGGTLFLNEIAELSPSNQGKLLRLIEYGEAHTIGALEPERVDVRIIAATKRNLQEQVVQKQFRSNLLYRLNTFQLEIPPLRKRPEDISALVAHFLKELAEQHNRRVRFTPEAIEAMRHLPLKGNARELRLLIERTVLAAVEGTEITRESVEVVVTRQTDKAALADAWAGCSFEEEVLQYEASLIRLALENAKGSVTRAARLLGVTHQRLCSMLQGRHKILLVAKKPAQKRRRSIITKLHR